ncbi:hypothetical protein RHGRI_028705 [Rhododendron griersonianum]|uniref:Ribulose bisphosphate carboxylase small subunit domain-containing protein n=1 Tax=Rhododendron griersonianum TaxID=479676 RepID=A0AAV6IKK2_9ERIC|nr:hypothetical protein RHGRI_028705 [Rhododendron griersonianum]
MAVSMMSSATVARTAAPIQASGLMSSFTGKSMASFPMSRKASVGKRSNNAGRIKCMKVCSFRSTNLLKVFVVDILTLAVSVFFVFYLILRQLVCSSSWAKPVWPPFGLVKFETLSYLPPLTREQLLKEVDYLIKNGWVPCLEFETEVFFPNPSLIC